MTMIDADKLIEELTRLSDHHAKCARRLRHFEESGAHRERADLLREIVRAVKAAKVEEPFTVGDPDGQ